MPTDNAQGSVKLPLPEWIWGRNPQGFLDAAALKGRRVSGEPGVWAVRTDESYRGQRPRLITIAHLAGPGVRSERYDLLSGSGVPSQVEVSAQSIEKVNRLGEKAEQSGRLADLVAHSQLSWLVAPDAQLADLAKHIHELFKGIQTVEDPNDHPFENSGVHFMRRDPCLGTRIKMPSVWLRMKYDPRLSSPNPLLIPGENAESLSFKSAFNLHDGMLLFDAYLAPLIGSLSPYIWGFFAAKPYGDIIMSLGVGLSDSAPTANELLQTLATQSARDAVVRPSLEATSCRAAVTWWVDALNDVFGVLADPAVFADADGYYNPSAQLEAFLTMEQLFRRVLSIQAAHNDMHARRVLLFTILDTLDQLVARPIEKHCRLSFAEDTLARLEQVIPTDAAKVLLKRAGDGVQALRDLQRGFFLASTNSQIVVPNPGGESVSLSVEEAVSHYVKLLRDATHGHGSVRPNKVDRTRALLAMHDGDVPHDLGWLGYLYLLDVISRPDVLRSVFSAGSREKSR